MSDDWLGDTDRYLPDDGRDERPGGAPSPPGQGGEPDYRCIRFLSNHCPYCGSGKFRTDRVQRSRTRIYRYHRCGDCGKRFKSIEAIEKKGKK